MLGSECDGWSPSYKLLEPSLKAAAGGAPLSVWAIDAEPPLRNAFQIGPRDVISNRPRWARRMLTAWQKEECAKLTPE